MLQPLATPHAMRNKIRHFNRRLEINRKRHIRKLHLLSRHPFMVPIAAFLVLVGLTSAAFWWMTHHQSSVAPTETDIVIISYDHQTQTVPSHEHTVGALLAKLHIPVNQGDVVEPASTTPINQDDFRINIYRAVPVKIIDGSTTALAYNAATTPRSIATEAGITIYPEDDLTTQPVNNILQEQTLGKVVTINRSTPITLSVNGLAAATRTRAKNVGAFLAEKHITLGQGVSVQPNPSTPIASGETVAVLRDGTGIQSAAEAIAMPTQYIDDDSLAYGTFAVRQAGSPGEQVSTYRITVLHGQVVSRTLLQTVVTVQPVTQIVVRGTNLSGIKGDMARAGISADDYQYADYIISHESGWCPTKAQGEHYCPAMPDNQYTPYGYGLCQATPGSKMSSDGADWATNPVTQLRWCSGYATSRYGGWYAAYTHWLNFHSW